MFDDQEDVVYADVYRHHKILVIHHHWHYQDPSSDDQQMMIDNQWYCGYVSRNRVDNKVILDVDPSKIERYLKDNTTCFSGITFVGQLTNDTHFMGDVYGFDTLNPSGVDFSLDEVVQQTKELCNQLVNYEEKHVVRRR